MCNIYMHVDELNVDGKFLIRSEVEVKKDEIQTIEKNFKRAYWPWELPESFRKQMTVRIRTYFVYLNIPIMLTYHT